jgi:hypothetical protein
MDLLRIIILSQTGLAQNGLAQKGFAKKGLAQTASVAGTSTTVILYNLSHVSCCATGQ